MPRGRTLLVAAFALLLPACSKSTDPSRLSEVFTGTLEVGGTNQHDFVVGAEGLVEITLTRLSPESSALVGLGIGEPTSTGCDLSSGVAGNVQAGAVSQLKGNASAGAWCVSLYDSGSLTQVNTYSVTVVHP